MTGNARNIFLILLVVSVPAFCGGTAFPGAEGFGANSRGGRGGKVIAVTNLNDSGPGSLRAACTAKGPRTIVFTVAGVIRLDSLLTISEPWLTIAGQTAPGEGICVTDFGCVVVNTHDVIIRYMRFRPGDTKRVEQDALWISGSQDVIIDHCSTSWGTDEVLSVTGGGATRISVQWCMITEALNNSVHHKGPHGYGSLIRVDGDVSFHHNLYAHNSSRNPRPGVYGDMERGSVLDFRNNIVYNWGERPGYSAEDKTSINYISNVVLPGPSTQPPLRDYAFYVGGIKTKLFMGNNLHGADVRTWELVRLEDPSWSSTVRLSTPLPVAEVVTDAPREAFTRVLADAGAVLPVRDAVDRRIVEEVKASGGRIIDSQKDVGGLPVYRTAQPLADTDNDGMPDGWELRHELNPEDASDGAVETQGYTYLEEYINSLTATDTSHSQARQIADSFLLRHPGAVTYDTGFTEQKWNYEQGLMLWALYRMSRHSGDAKYYQFVEKNLDQYVDENGRIRSYKLSDYNLDLVAPGRSLLVLYQMTKQEKYRHAADTLRRQLREQPRTEEGGFWHKKIYPYQMWLDGLFMAEPFYAMYAGIFNEPDAYDDIANQFIWIARHTRDPKTGLYFHGWDEKKQQEWAGRNSGCSPSLWGRAMGWFAMGLVDVLEYFPEHHPKRNELLEIFRDLCAGLLKWRDRETNLWYLVLDQGQRKGNYFESSSAAMFTYAFARGSREGYLDKKYFHEAERSFDGILRHHVTIDGKGLVSVHNTIKGAGLGGPARRNGSFEYYASEQQRTNDMKGIGPLLLAAIELERGR